VLAVRPSDMYTTLGVAIAVIVFVALYYKELLVSSFDPVMAQAYGLKVQVIHYALMFFLTLVAVSSLQTVGTVLVIAMLITPAATAYLLTDKLSIMIVVASLLGAISAVVGLFFSYSYNLASGATIVLTSAVFFIIAFIFSPKQGIVFKRKEELIIEEN
jgi:iron/zinc/copper transport system permease protein